MCCRWAGRSPLWHILLLPLCSSPLKLPGGGCPACGGLGGQVEDLVQGSILSLQTKFLCDALGGGCKRCLADERS